MHHVIELEHLLCTDNIEVNRNVRAIIASVMTYILAHRRYLTRQVYVQVGQVLITLPELESSSPVFSGIFVARSLVFFCAVFIIFATERERYQTDCLNISHFMFASLKDVLFYV